MHATSLEPPKKNNLEELNLESWNRIVPRDLFEKS